MFSRVRAKAVPDNIGRRVTNLASSAGERISDLASDQRQNAGWIAATFLALGLGFLLGLILAPRSGRETREKIGERAKNVTSIVNRRRGDEENEQVSGDQSR